MAHGIRVKTDWHSDSDEPKGPEEQATVVATNIWKLADRLTINLQEADYDIVDLQRGIGIMVEAMAFMVHLSDRLIFGRIDDDERTAFISTMAGRLAEIVEGNIHDLLDDHDHPYQAAFLEKINARSAEYATFDFDPEHPGYPVRHFLGSCVRDLMLDKDKSWIADQISEIEIPKMLDVLKRTIDGLYPKHTPAG